MTKIDTSLAFCFYLKDYQDYLQFKGFMEEGRLTFKENWLFSIFESKPSFETFSSRESLKESNFYLPKTSFAFEEI